MLVCRRHTLGQKHSLDALVNQKNEVGLGEVVPQCKLCSWELKLLFFWGGRYKGSFSGLSIQNCNCKAAW